MTKRKIKENSKTNCPECGCKKPFKYVGECPKCTYPENNNDDMKLTKEEKKND